MKPVPLKLHLTGIKGDEIIIKLTKLMVFVWVVGIAMSGCPQSGELISDTGKSAEVREKLRKLDVQYGILGKDNPPQTATLPYRQGVAEVEATLKQGDEEKADRIANAAQDWMDEARVKYYRQHKELVAAGKGESADELMSSAEFYLNRALASKIEEDQWAADQYFKAAIEQGELSLLAKQQKPDQVFDLIKLYPRLMKIYEKAGKPQQAAQLKQKVIQSIETNIASLDKKIDQCLDGKAEGCEPEKFLDTETREEGEEAIKQKAKEIEAWNELRNRIAEQARTLDPNRFPELDYLPRISAWRAELLAMMSNQWDRPAPPEHNPDMDKQEKELREKLEKQNRLKQGAVPIQGSGISIKVNEIYVVGDAVVIRGNITNNSTVPIYNPRITVTGDVAGNVVDLGYPNGFKPQVTTTFQIQLTTVTPEAYFAAAHSLPRHEFLVIYRDADGNEKKLLKPMY